MYLSHALLAQIFATLFLAFGQSVHGFNAVYVSALDWIATLTISALVYSFFEKPLMELRERSFTSFLKPGQKRKSTSEGHPPTDEYEGQGPEAAP
jgi:peptidoglycan/LPS O-acetylase OafA/YrhL